MLRCKGAPKSLCGRPGIFFFVFLVIAPRAFAQAVSPLPRIDRTGRHPALIVDGSPFLMLGAQINNSSAWPSTLPAVWITMAELGANTVEAPVYWETLEPEEGQFNFSQVDTLLDGARAHHLHLVLLWFGTWKNGSPGYAPHWIKSNPQRFPLVRKPDGEPVFSLSPFGKETLAADIRAFTALMKHIKSADPDHTVLMVQVENETGVWGSMRDNGKEANVAFAAPVPAAVLNSMGMHDSKGTWAEVFKADADEFFCAWSIARYVEAVTAAGKAVLPLPMYVNAALRDPLQPSAPLTYESGGPTYDVLALWHATAPSLDALAPDIYLPDYAKYTAVLDQYAFSWNALFIPEMGNRADYARYFSSALGHGAFGFSPFGMDATGYSSFPLGAKRLDEQTLAPFAWNYAVAGPLQRELATWLRDDRVRGVAEDPAHHTAEVKLPGSAGKPAHWQSTVSFGLPAFGMGTAAPGNKAPEGEALIVSLGPDEVLVTGRQCRVDFNPTGTASNRHRMWDIVEEGSYQGGQWVRTRLWNGDQTDYGLNFGKEAIWLRVRLQTF